MKLLVVFRVDASPQIGEGHLIRCSALGRALQRCGAQVVFLVNLLPDTLLPDLEKQNIRVIQLGLGSHVGQTPWQIDEVEDAKRTREALDCCSEKPKWLVVDHYGIDIQWEVAACPADIRLLVIDDLADRQHRADTLVDPNMQRYSGRYESLVPFACTLLLGPRFALLRSEFLEQLSSIPRGVVRSPRRLLACMGGADPTDTLSTIIDAWELLPLPRPLLDLAVGAGSPNVEKLRARCENLTGVTLHVQTQHMALLMSQADLFLGSAGGISWERCRAGLPAVMGATANNQLLNIAMLTRNRTGVSIGDWRSVDCSRLASLIQKLLRRPRLLLRMSKRSAALVDARGAQRVALHMSSDEVCFRYAQQEDAEQCWRWRNSESTYRYFHVPVSVPLVDHVAWWVDALCDSRRDLLIAQINDEAIGVLRLDYEQNQATVSIYLDPELTGLGLGTNILKAAQRWISLERPGCCLRAEILPANTQSIRSFEAVGFQRCNDQWVWTPHE